MTYLLCVYLVFKGVEIFQIGLASGHAKSRTFAIVIGVLAIIVSIGAASTFSGWVDEQAESIQRTTTRPSITP